MTSGRRAPLLSIAGDDAEWDPHPLLVAGDHLVGPHFQGEIVNLGRVDLEEEVTSVSGSPARR